MSSVELALAIGFAVALLVGVFAHHKSSQRRAGARANSALAIGGTSATSQADGAVCETGIAGSGACDAGGDGGGGGGGD